MKKPPFLQKIKRFQQIESTNILAEDWIADELPAEGSAVIADFQTKGAGMAGNSWESEAGKNLLISFILYPDFLDASDQFMINKVVSLAVQECVRRFVVSTEISVKWPNDIYAGNRKIAGILSRNSISGNKMVYSVVGIGLNVNQEKFSREIPNPVSMKMLTGSETDRDEVMKNLALQFENYYQILKGDDKRSIDELYLNSLYKLNQKALFMQNKEPFAGIIKGVSRFGFLQIAVNGVIKEFDIKDVQFVTE